jgi:hypothetical protein
MASEVLALRLSTMRRAFTIWLMFVLATAAFQPLAMAMNACCVESTSCAPRTPAIPTASSAGHDHAHMHHGALSASAPSSTLQSRHVHDHGCPMQCCSTAASASAVLTTPSLQIADTNQAVSLRIAEAQRQTYRFTRETTERGPPALLD